jgi:lipoyl(octanoyl) transferase
LIDPPASGQWHMAVDQVLLETAAESGRPSLRFYTWSEPTLSLGYFQRYADREQHRASLDCPLVRRQTGGGAILHDRELTYSVAASALNRSTAEAQRLYDSIHTALVDVLAMRGIEARLCMLEAAPDTQATAFLCFERRSRGDVLLGKDKICGSAQRRLQAGILQHGSLLLARSAAAPRLAGLSELTGKAWDIQDVLEPWRREIASRLHLALEPQPLTPLELDRVRQLVIEKYDAARWNRRR